MRIVMAGASGFLGRHLSRALTANGHRVDRLVRRTARDEHEFTWDPYRRRLDRDLLSGADAVVNLCGVGVADRRWSPAYKELIRHSRITPTKVLAEAVAETHVPVLLNASAVGWYERGDHAVDESAPHAPGFLGETCAEWEEATAAAEQAGARVVRLRTGHVVSADSVMIKRLLPIFKLGIGGRFGSGRQYFPWISLPDWLGAARFALDHDISGPVNLVGPTPVTNAEFTRALGRVLRRPAVLAVPGFALKIAAGEAAVELLTGAKIIPKALTDNDYSFAHSTVDEALSAALGR
ncbi:MAG: TIGR01777 family oxidoreductase [Stackebrandtia sp.]